MQPSHPGPVLLAGALGLVLGCSQKPAETPTTRTGVVTAPTTTTTGTPSTWSGSGTGAGTGSGSTQDLTPTGTTWPTIATGTTTTTGATTGSGAGTGAGTGSGSGTGAGTGTGGTWTTTNPDTATWETCDWAAHVAYYLGPAQHARERDDVVLPQPGRDQLPVRHAARG